MDNIDFVMDAIGGEVLDNSVKVMKIGGSIVTLPSSLGISDKAKAEAAKINVDISGIMVKSNGNDMNTLMNLLKNGKIVAHVSKKYPFTEMGKAHSALETGRTVGKLIVLVNNQ